ncbi:MAG: hypothetical protein LBL54_03225 [Clostridiales Family XIII bacterium]|jgi:hypothetical protein|nr:hypothetical protein [Clostridiales Family XIII bacterium]
MSAFDIKKNVDNRAAALLEHHMSLLGVGAGFSRKDTLTYERNGAEDGNSLLICYDEKSKFMTKTYNLMFKLRVPGADLGDSFKARIKFRGMKQIDAGFFEIKPENKTAETLLNDPKLIDEIVETAQKVDIATIKAEYSAGTEAITITLVPYAGAFLWVKLPPVYYPLKLNQKEMNQLHTLLKKIEKHINKRLE